MSITLPPLPERNPRSYKWTEREKQELRARDLEVAQLVLEAAAKVCEHWSNRNHVYVNGALRCGKDIRALEVRHHE